MAINSIQLDEIDRKAADALPGMVVRKDLVRMMRSSFSVPVFVVEFLLGKYCASTDPEIIEDGLAYVKENLADKYVRADEREMVKARLQAQGSYQIIDKVTVKFHETQVKYWAELANIDLSHVNIREQDVREHERLLTGGIWAEVTLGYDDDFVFKGVNRPFSITKLRPIQLSQRDITPYIEARNQFTTDEWLDFLLRSLGLEPTHPAIKRRQKLLYISRLIPLVERNFNLIELGPRGTGKSFVFQQISPYAHLVSGGQTTVAQLFVNLATGQKGLVCLWDTVAFDEAAGISFRDSHGINIMKGYMEDGIFSRGRDVITADGSIVLLGNIDGDIETIARTSNLFYPMPDQMDTAFFDRLHFYLPGWEIDKTRDDYYTDHFGMVSDFFSEALTELRKRSYTDMAESQFRFGDHLTGRDQKAVRKTVSGLVKLLNPHGEVSKDELEEYLSVAMEMRRRVKEQLKKMGGIEYWNVNFSYIDIETQQETFVPLPETGGGTLIASEQLPPGSVYTIGRDPTDDRLALYLIQAQANPGSGRIIPLGNLSRTMKEAIKTADAYLRANIRNLGIERDLDGYDFSLQAVNLNQAKEGSETAIAFFISMVSAHLERPVKPRLVVVGEMSVQGMLLGVSSLTERMQFALDAGAKTILVPSENKRDLASVPDDVLNKIQPVFYTDPINAAIRAMDME